MNCLADWCKNKAMIEVKVTLGRLEQRFGFCLEHAHEVQPTINQLTAPKRFAVCRSCKEAMNENDLGENNVCHDCWDKYDK